MRKTVFVLVLIALFSASALMAQAPEPSGWYSGDMHVHRSCGGSPESVSSIFNKMDNENISSLSLLADMGNGEVQNASKDLPLVNGQDASISGGGKILHWDAEWHWDATYNQYAHQALGGHIVALGLKEAHQIWDESTYPIFQWAHAQNGIAGFAHFQYLDSNFPQTLSCCTPVEYPVEVALGAADFISEDVNGSDAFTTAYYRLLNSGFRPGFAAGTDYPCGTSNIGDPVTYVRIPSGSMTYRNWIDGIAAGRTVVSRNGHNEFLDLVVNGTARPGDEIRLSAGGSVPVTVQWIANQTFSGTVELVMNGSVVATKQESVTANAPMMLTTTVSFPKSSWLAARRSDVNGHVVHTAAVFVIVNNTPIRANATDPQFYAQWMNNLLTNTATTGIWSSYYPTERSLAQGRYQAAKALFQQIAKEASGTAPSLTSIAVTPANSALSSGSTQQFKATGTYADGSSLDLTGQAGWNSSNPIVATVNGRGLAYAISNGTTSVTATLGNVSGSTILNVQQSPLIITTQSLPGGSAGVAYSSSITASGGTIPYVWSIVSGSLPTGVSLNSTTGALTGTPTSASTFTFTLRVADSGSPQQIVAKQLAIVVAPSAAGSCPCSIWSINTVPGIADSGPDSAVELGVTFRTDIDGFITGMRFYKGNGNTGTHVGNLWTSTGSLLESATFTGETASGWQQVNFSNPVAVTANTVYVASYHTNVGHYSDDQNYFASGVDNAPLHAVADGTSGLNGVYSYGSGSSFPNQSWRSSNYWIDVVFTPASVSTAPTVTAVHPSAGATGVSIGTAVSATFNHSMSAASINGTTFLLSDSQGNLILGTVAYTAATSTATLTPTAELNPSTTYKATVVGGSGGVQDFNGNTMTSDFTWFLTTGAAPQPDGPGGPILVISSVLNPFSRYYSEILNAEGLNEYLVADISTVTPTMLTNYDVAILGEMSLTSTQASMLSDWVSAGGHLIAMRPDKQLAPMLGLTSTTSTLSNAYLKVQTASGPGMGIVSQTIQFHGTADLFTLNGGTSIATLYSTASTSTSFPAVSLMNLGTGQAAAFTYDLAKSVVYTRQGNPAWSGEKRDGQIPPTRSDDLYFGNATFDPQPDWVNLSKVAIPQADEQQRLLANLISQMAGSRKPLPRFWYLPGGFKAAVVMTGDDHGNDGTSGRFDIFLTDSATGCSVPDWQCVRSTSYIYPTTPISSSQIAAYTAQGFEVALHVTTDCADWTPNSLESFYADQLAIFASAYSTAAAPKTNRTHCIAWSDYDTQPKIELSHGIRLDANYYYWPPSWVNDQPGMFTGSGMPMRFTDRNGNLIDVYQAATQMTDESGQSYPFNIDSLLNNAVGPQGFYGVFTANMHNDSAQSDGADEIVASAQSHGVPVISALQMLTWLDGRNSSAFRSLVWSGNTLSFTVAQGNGARNLRAMLPSNGPGGTLSSITMGGNPVIFTTQTIKGISYAMFAAAAGSYQAVYGGASAAVLSSISVNPTTVVGGTGATGTVTLSGPAPSGGATVALSSSNTAAVQTPSNVVVPSGNTNATFTVTTSVVSANTAVTISGSLGSTQTTNLTVTPAAVLGLASVSLSPASVIGGSSSTGTVTLSRAAPRGGITVALSSSNTSVAQLPIGVTVAAGNTVATFVVTTSAVAAKSTVDITGSYGSTQAGASLTVNPATVSAIAVNPSSVSGGASSTGTVTLTGPSPTGGASVSLQSSSTAVATVPAFVTVPAGSTSSTFAVNTFTVASNTSVTISATLGVIRTATLSVNAVAVTLSSVSRTPTSVVGGASSTGTVTLTGAAPSSGAVVSLQSNNSSVAQVPGSVTIAAGTTSSTFTITTTPVSANTSAIITATYAGVARTTTVTVNAATLASISRSPGTVVGGASSTGTVTLNGVAPTGGATVTLQSSNVSVAQVPTSVSVAGGATSASFTITTSSVAASTTVTLSGSYGVARTTTLTVNAATLSSISRSPSSVVGGNNATGTVTLNGAAPTGGAKVTLQSNMTTAAQVPSSVTIPAGKTSTTFTITTSGVAASSTVTLTAVYGNTRTTTLSVSVASLSSLTLDPSTLTGGSSSTGTLTLNGAAPPAGAVIALISSRTSAAQVPPSATVPAGARSITFTVTTSAVHGTSSTISGTYRSTSRTATLTIQ